MPVTQFQGLTHGRMVWTIPDLLPVGNVTIIAGEPNVGKSRFWTQSAWMLSRGIPFFWPQMDPIRVLYASERNAGEVIEQMDSLKIDFAKANPYFRLLTIGDMSQAEAAEMNRDPLGLLHAHVIEWKPQVVVLDTMGHFLISVNGTNVHNVNDYGSTALKMRTFTQWCHWHSTSLVGVHHMRKQTMNDSSLRTQDRTLGSQALVGNSGQIWLLENLTSEDVKTSDRFVKVSLSVHCRPWRAPIYLRATLNEPFVVCSEAEALEANVEPADRLITAPLQEKIIEALPKGGAVVSKVNLVDALSQSCSCDPHNVYKAIKKLVEKGKVMEQTDPDSGLQLVSVVVKQ